MIPSAWIGVVLALAVFRVTRIIGWDDFPPIVRARAWVVGARRHSRSASSNAAMGLTGEEPETYITYRRPTLAHMIGCAYCMGFWLSLVAYWAWVWQPTVTLYVAAAFALNAAVGITARKLDP